VLLKLKGAFESITSVYYILCSHDIIAGGATEVLGVCTFPLWVYGICNSSKFA